jgi:hypothetical protein
MNVIVLSTNVKLGNIVYKKVDDSKQQLMVTGFLIHAVDEVGQVIHYSICCSDGAGNILDYKEYELEQCKTTY